MASQWGLTSPVLVIIVLLSCTTRMTQGIWLDLPATGTKCVSEDIHNNVVVLADYALINNQQDSHLHPPATISVKVINFSFFVFGFGFYDVGRP